MPGVILPRGPRPPDDPGADRPARQPRWPGRIIFAVVIGMLVGVAVMAAMVFVLRRVVGA